MNELVSIIVPVYNVSRYIRQCVDSLIKQSYRNTEILLIDDGSTDESGSICDQYALSDKRVHVFHKNNGGLSDARNVGLNNAKGDLIAFVDSDDWVEETWLYELVMELQKKKADIVAGGFVAHFKNGSYIHKEKEGIYTSEEALQLLLENIYLHDHVCTKVFKRSLWDTVRFPKNVLFEDIRTTYKTFLQAKTIVVTSGCKYNYRQRGTSIARGGFNAGKLKNLESIQYLMSDESIKKRSEYVNLLKKRLTRVNAYLFREMMLSLNFDKMNEIEKDIAKELYSRVKADKNIILNEKDCETSIKLIAFIAGFGFPITQRVLNSSLVTKYYGSKYICYE